MNGSFQLRGESEILFRGPIRAGRPGVMTSRPFTVRRSLDYDIAFLDDDAPRVDYESDEYRESYDGSSAVEEFHRLHDPQARRYLSLLEGVQVRGRVVADFGCGAGSVLDLLQGLARRTIGIEPHRGFRRVLSERGHRVYAYGAEMLAQEGDGSIDIALAHHVIEHIDDPWSFLGEMYRCLRPGGLACVATPNLHDLMLSLGGEPYRQFYFRTAHRWYFSGPGLSRLAAEAGFDSHRIGYLQEYDLGNAFSWLRHGRPCGNGSIPELDRSLDSAWRASLEESGRANLLFLLAIRPLAASSPA